MCVTGQELKAVPESECQVLVIMYLTLHSANINCRLGMCFALRLMLKDKAAVTELLSTGFHRKGHNLEKRESEGTQVLGSSLAPNLVPPRGSCPGQKQAKKNKKSCSQMQEGKIATNESLQLWEKRPSQLNNRDFNKAEWFYKGTQNHWGLSPSLSRPGAKCTRGPLLQYLFPSPIICKWQEVASCHADSLTIYFIRSSSNNKHQNHLNFWLVIYSIKH